MTERNLFDPAQDTGDEVKAALSAEIDEDARRLELEDLERLMGEPWGRRVAHRVIFRIGGFNRLSFEPKIKDGIAAALHMARNEGLREGAAVLAGEVQRHYPDLWDLMVSERQRARFDLDARRREVLDSRSHSTEGDGT